MNTGRFVGAVVGTFVVRTLFNYLFYGMAMRGEAEKLSTAHPGIFREVIPAYVLLDLVFAVIFVLLFVKVGRALGGGVKGGADLGFFAGLIGGVLPDLYVYYSFTVFTLNFTLIDAVYQLVATTIVGAVAGFLYKDAAMAPAT